MAATAERDTALPALFHAQYATLLKLATLLTDASTAEDIVQDAFARTYRRWDRLDDPGRADAYLRACVVNGSRSWLRRVRVARRHVEPAVTDAESAEDSAALRAEHREVLEALGRLSTRQREVLVLRYYGDFTETDIATALGISAGAVKTHAHRGIQALGRALEAST